MNDVTKELVLALEDFYNDSEPTAIERGDELHQAVVGYKKSLDGRLPPDEARLMREMLDLSRSGSFADRRTAQERATAWERAIEAKHAIPWDKLAPADVACLNVLTDAPERSHIIADRAGLREASTARKSLSKLKKLGLATKTKLGFLRAVVCQKTDTV